MTFKLNALVAALVMAASAPALATIEDSSLGNGELFMTVWDEVGQKSYTLDLNLRMNDFLSGVAVSGTTYNYAADANMSSFLSMVAPADKSGLKFAIGAMDGSGANSTDYYRFISTASNIVLGNSLTNQVTNENLKNFAASGDQFLGDTNGSLAASGENSLIVTDPALVSYAGSAQWGNNWGSAANFTSTGLIDNDAIVDGGDLGLYFLRQSSGAYAPRNNASIYEGIFQGGNQVYANLDMNGNLLVAAVPEAETYAMMLAGLGLIGFMVARRRVV